MQLQFFYDYRSIYAYLANSQVRKLGVTVDYQLVDIIAVMRAVNNQPSPKCPPKAKYSFMDSMRWANIYGIPLSPNENLLHAMREEKLPSGFLSRAGLAAQTLGVFDTVNDAIFKAVWAGKDDLTSKEGRLRFTTDHGIPAHLWDMADSPEIITQLRANDRVAIGKGVFGAPTFYIGDEMYFGNDRLIFVQEKLRELAQKGEA